MKIHKPYLAKYDTNIFTWKCHECSYHLIYKYDKEGGNCVELVDIGDPDARHGVNNSNDMEDWIDNIEASLGLL